MGVEWISSCTSTEGVTHVEKAWAYITRAGRELLVFDGPGHDGLQVPKGTVEAGEMPREAMYREVVEESGLATLGFPRHLVTDVWTRSESPPKRYVRSFFHAQIHEPRDAWTHTVTGTDVERGEQFEFSWMELPTDSSFALDLGDYLPALTDVARD